MGRLTLLSVAPIIHLVPADVSVASISASVPSGAEPAEKSREASQTGTGLIPLPNADSPTEISKEFYNRMKRSLALIVMLASGLVLGANAQTSPAVVAAPAGPAKIAVIAFQVAVAQTNEGQRNFADLQKKFAPREAQIKAEGEEIDTLTKQLQAQGDKLSDVERANRAKTIDEKKKKAQRDLEDAQSDMNTEMQELYNALASKVYDVLANYAQKQGYTLVLDIAQQQNPVLYASESTNITQQIKDAYNAKSGVPAPPAPTAGSHPTTSHPAAHSTR
jgi:outer membrane protein